MEDAIDLALTAPAPPVRAEAAKDVVLTRREQQVAAYIAQGLTNHQIGEALIVSERTVDAHVDHIRAELGVRTRAAIAGWAMANASVSTR